MKFAVLGLGEAGSNFANDFARMGASVCGSDPNLIHKLDPKVVFKSNNSSSEDIPSNSNANDFMMDEGLYSEIIHVSAIFFTSPHD